MSKTRTFANREKNKGHRGHRKVKCERDQGLVMYVKFSVHSNDIEISYSAKRGGQIDREFATVTDVRQKMKLKVIYHPLYSMNKFVTN